MDQNMQSARKEREAKNLKKSIISLLALTLVFASLFIAQTYAYFSEVVTGEENQIVSGKLDVELIETRYSENSETTYVNPVHFTPKTEVSKIVKIKNVGTLPVYIRIKINKSINKQEDEIPVDWENLIICNVKVDDEGTEDIEGLWILHDGYYYYILPLAPDCTTMPLFDTVIFSADMGNEFTDCEINLSIECQSVQSNNNSGNPITAWGWPE